MTETPKPRLALAFMALPLPVKVVLILVVPALVLVGGFMVAIAVAALPATWPLAVIAAVKKRPRHTWGVTFTRLGRGMRHRPTATGVAFGLGVVAAIAVHLQAGGGIPSTGGDWVYLISTVVGIGALAAIAVAVVQHARGAVAEPTEAPAEDLPRIEEA